MLIKQSTLDYYEKNYGRPMAAYFRDEIENLLRTAKRYNSAEDASRDAKAAWNDESDAFPTILKAPDEYSEGGRYYLFTEGNWEHLIRLAGFELYEEWWAGVKPTPPQ